jgi:hypothetical protein
MSQHAFCPSWASNFPWFCGDFQIRVAGATLGFSAKMGSLAPFLSKAGDLDDFPARFKLLKFIGKK